MSWTTLDIPSDGPDAALVYVVRRLRLPYSRVHVNKAVLEHPQPNSLLALVEVAAGLGLDTKPARIEPSALSDLDGPVVVHFAPQGSEGGFGILEEVQPGGYAVWDSVNGRRVMSKELFLGTWSGIVVLVSRGSARGPRERGYLGRRVFEIVAGRLEAPALVGRRAVPALRAGIGVLVAGTLALAIAGRPPGERWAAAALVAVTLLGLAVTVLTALSVGDQKHPFSTKVCARGKLIDCESVLTSRYSRAFGIPLSEIGIGYFGAVILLLATSGSATGDLAPWFAAGIAYSATLPASIALIGVQVAMRQLCTMCLVVHAVNVCGTAVFWFGLAGGTSSRAAVAASFLLLAFFGIVIVLLVVPFLMTGARMEAMTGSWRKMMASPFATLAQVLTETPTEVRGAACGVAFGPAAGEHELVVFVHPGCSRCEPVLNQAVALADDAAVSLFIAIAPKAAEEAERAACTAVVAAGRSLEPGGIRDAYLAAKGRADDWPWDDPVGVLASALGRSGDGIRSELDAARGLVTRAEELADAYTEGTPAVFLDHRPYRAALGHLAVLLREHRDLLQQLRPGVADAPAANVREVTG
ncbi:MAG: vitamin K epoxide reductase family protein [Actinomycetota bacterium]